MCSKPDIESYWATWWPCTTPSFSTIMRRDRFQLLRIFLHFNDNEKRIEKGNDGYDPLYKIKPIFDIVNSQLTDVYGPGPYTSFDEAMRLFKGRWAFKQYNPKKPVKWGIKNYMLAESHTGYILKQRPYVGKGTVTPQDGRLVTEQLVIEMCAEFGEGMVVYMDNFYMSPRLVKELKESGKGACGTVRVDRRGMPQDIKGKKLTKEDPPYFTQTTDGDILCVSWQDTKRVTMLSSINDNKVFVKEVFSSGSGII